MTGDLPRVRGDLTGACMAIFRIEIGIEIACVLLVHTYIYIYTHILSKYEYAYFFYQILDILQL